MYKETVKSSCLKDFKETKAIAQGENIQPNDKKILSYSYSKDRELSTYILRWRFSR